MRSETDLQHAHDVLHYLLTRECPLILGDHDREHVRSAHDALAWALGSACGRAFGANFERATEELASLGIGFVDAGVVTPANPLRRNPS
jgi:hypothetical protein